MKIHFAWPISANNKMITMSRILIKSAEGINAHFTILVQKKECKKAAKHLDNIAEVLPYETEPEFLHPWVSTPKWSIEPNGDVLLGLDADTIVWNKEKLLEHVQKAYNQKTIYATIAYENPFREGIWQSLFSQYKMKDEFKYRFYKTGTPAPYYINNGAVVMPIESLSIFRFYHKKWLLELNKKFHNLFYISQVANTFAIKESGLSAEAAPRCFNYLESSGLFDIDQNIDKIAIFHYNNSKNLSNFKNIKTNIIRNKFLELQPKIKSLI